MVTNVELVKNLDEQEEEYKLLRNRLVQLEHKLYQVEEQTKEVKEKVKGKHKQVDIEDEVP